uniref:LIM zinc-binding domain-containing protein n=1 Tax=Arcella intermedia TaxID=1963864 RepID=A0A6B2L6P4_9EUKA
MNGPGGRMNGPGGRMSGPGVTPHGPGQGGAFHGPGFVPSPPMPTGTNPTIQPETLCSTCQEPIQGPLVQAMGKSYHPDHFVCECCSQPFPGGRFIKASDEHLYCEQDYEELFARRCKVCHQTITGKIVNAEGATYHPEHFICVGCGDKMVGQPYKVHPETKHVYCKKCLPPEMRKIRPEEHICAKCSQGIAGPYLLIKGQFVHLRHFTCQECGTEFKGGDCHEFEGNYYCLTHYKIQLLKKCARCGKPCQGRSVTALGKVWHPDHFTCHICSVPFAESHYYENDGLPYCKTHYVQLFGYNCAHCKEPILKNTIKFLDKAYHADHFLCSHCQHPLKPARFTAWDSKPICLPCYDKLPAHLRKEVQTRTAGEQKAKAQRDKEL